MCRCSPPKVGCVIGVKVGKGSGTDEPNDNVGVTVAGGACGVVSASDCVQAESARMTSREVNIFLFIAYPFIATILAFFERDCKSVLGKITQANIKITLNP